MTRLGTTSKLSLAGSLSSIFATGCFNFVLEYRLDKLEILTLVKLIILL